jgi:lysophospholipase L1-like esterase
MKLKIIAITILVSLTACSKSNDNNTQVIVPAPPKPRVWFYGDSMTEGYGASNPGKRWTTQLCYEKKWYEVNVGKAFETLIQTTASEDVGHTSFFSKYQTAIIPRTANDKYMFIAYGANDCAFNYADYTTDLFSTQLQTIISFANSKGWPNNSIVVLCGYYENKASWSISYGGVLFDSAASMGRYYSFIAAAQTVANNNAGVYFINPFNVYDASGQADGLHANDEGHAALAAYVASLIP